jgi:type IV pilus assembly protein PilN
MKIRLNVATRPLESHRRFIAGAMLAGGAALVALLFLASSVVSTWRRNRGQRAQIAAYEARLERMSIERQSLAAYFDSPNTKTVIDRAAFLNSLIDQRSFPWTKIFTDLEKVLPDGVSVVSIAPKMEDGRVNVSLVVSADSDKSKIEFLEALQSSPAFSQVQVNSETRTQQSGGQDQVDVDLEAVYSGGGSGGQ